MDNFKLTDKGRTLLSKVVDAPLTLTNMSLGKGIMTVFNPNITTLVDEVMKQEIENCYQEGAEIYVRTIFTNENLATGFYVNEIGIFAQDPDEGEILYAYTNTYGEPTDYFKPGLHNVILKEIIEAKIIFGNASEVLITADPSKVYATLEELETVNQKKLNIGNDYRPNLIDNGDFQIWNKGTSFTPVVQGDVVARWRYSAGVANAANIEKSITGLKLTPLLTDGTLVFLSQWIENGYKHIGKTMTLSIKLNGTVYKVTGDVLVDDNVVFDISDDVKMYFGYVTTLDCIAITIHTAATTLNINWAKLELNDHATPFIPKSYKEELLNCSENIGYFPNLLINGDFKVWQRGESLNIGASNIRYTADRWVFLTYGDATINKATKGININFASNKFYFKQMIEDLHTTGTFTLSAKIKAPENTSFLFGISYDKVIHEDTVEGTGEYKIYKKTVDIQSRNGFDYIEAMLLHDGSIGEYEIEWAKLELNDHATPFIPRSYAEELTLCKRYYEVIESYNFIAIYSNADDIYMPNMQYAVEKRIVPTISLGSQPSFRNGISEWQTGFTLSTTGATKQAMKGSIFTKPSHGLSNSTFINGELNWVQIDAEI